MIDIDFLYTIIGTPLGYIMWACYLLVNNFGWAIIIFTVIVKAATFPLSLKQQKNMAKSQLFTPKVREIQQKYRNNQEKQQEELAKLQKEGYNPMGGCGTMLLTFLILFGVIDVVYKPMTHMEHLDWGDSGAVSKVVTRAKQTDYALILLSNPDDLQVYLEYLEDPQSLTIITQESIDALAEEAQATATVQEQVVIPEEAQFNLNEAKAAVEYDREKNKLTEEQWSKLTNLSDDTVTTLAGNTSRLSKEIKNALNVSKGATFVSLRQELAALRIYTQHKEAFADLPATQGLMPETLEKLDRLSNNMKFAGLDLGETPGWEFPLLIVPILSLLMSVAQMAVSQVIQKKTNPELAQQQGCAKYMLFVMPLFSLYIAFQVPAGVGFYWAVSYVFGIIQTLVIYKFWPNEKLQAQARLELEKKSSVINATATVVDIDENGNEVKVSKKMSEMTAKELKEYQRKKLEEARRADAEKYGDEDIPDLPPLEEDKPEDKADDTTEDTSDE